jgi:hypothetical protein
VHRAANVSGKQAGTKKPASGKWLNPDTGTYDPIPSGTTIQTVNGKRTPVKIGATVKTLKSGKQVVVGGTSKKPAAAHMQSKTINGNTVLFDPGSGTTTRPVIENPVDPNMLKGKSTITPDKLLHVRAQAVASVTGTVASNPKILPSVMYRNGVAKGIPGWQMVQALRQEARNHPDDKAWQNVLKRGWVAGR